MKIYFMLVNDQFMKTDWKQVQKHRFATRHNWSKGTAHLIKCAGHTERYDHSI